MDYQEIQCICGKMARIVECGAGTYINCQHCGRCIYMCTTKEDAIKKFKEKYEIKMENEITAVKITSFEEYEHIFDEQWQQNQEKAAELVEGFMKIGYLLKLARDTEILSGTEYADYIDFARKKYDIGKDVVSRYININNAFSEGGNSMELQEKYKGFGYAKLALMLTLPEEIREEITPAYSKSEIQAIKDEVDEENEVSDIEVILQGQKFEQMEMSNLDKAFHQLFEDEPELYVELFKNVNNAYEILAPNEEKTYSIRISGVGRLMMFVKETGISLANIRALEEKESHGWEAVINSISKFVENGENPKTAWETMYDKPFPEEKQEVAPVQPKQAPRKESKVQKAPKPEPKKAPEVKPEVKQEEENNVTEDVIAEEAVPVDDTDEIVEEQESGEVPADIEADEQHSTMQVQRQKSSEKLEEKKKQLIEEVHRVIENMKADLEAENWTYVKIQAENIKRCVEDVQKVENEIADIMDTSQMRIENYEEE